MDSMKGSWVNIDNKEEKLGDMQLFHAALLTLKSRCLLFAMYSHFALMEACSRVVFHPPLILMPKAQFQHIRLLVV